MRIDPFIDVYSRQDRVAWLLFKDVEEILAYILPRIHVQRIDLHHFDIK